MGERKDKKDKKERNEEGKEKKKREIGVKKRETILIFVSLFNIGPYDRKKVLKKQRRTLKHFKIFLIGHNIYHWYSVPEEQLTLPAVEGFPLALSMALCQHLLKNI